MPPSPGERAAHTPATAKSEPPLLHWLPYGSTYRIRQTHLISILHRQRTTLSVEFFGFCLGGVIAVTHNDTACNNTAHATCKAKLGEMVPKQAVRACGLKYHQNQNCQNFAFASKEAISKASAHGPGLGRIFCVSTEAASLSPRSSDNTHLVHDCFKVQQTRKSCCSTWP